MQARVVVFRTFNYLMTLDRPNGDSQAERKTCDAREREQICRQVKVLSSQQRISPEGSQTDSQPKLECPIYIHS